MKHFFVNLKRFDVPIQVGGVCPHTDPGQWIEQVITQSVELKLGQLDNAHLTFFLPEGLILCAQQTLASMDRRRTKTISIGCQGVYRENVAVGGNFGAFTSLLPAAAARNLGAQWSIVGHSEERKDKLGILSAYHPPIALDAEERSKANASIHKLLRAEAHCAWESGMNVLFCIGETMEDKGEGTFEEQKPNIDKVLKQQLIEGLPGVEAFKDRIVIAYEPMWAVGPGKTPPNGDYISYAAARIQAIVQEQYGFNPSIVYGGGLKEENALEISSIPQLDGGLIALTNFVGQPGFTVEGLSKVIETTVWFEKA